MNWEGSDKQKEAVTNDGYHLIVKRIGEDKYAWKVYHNSRNITSFDSKPVFKKTLPQAKRQAIQLMINHLLKRRKVFTLL